MRRYQRAGARARTGKFRKISRVRRDGRSRALHTKELHYVPALPPVFRETDYARANGTIESAAYEEPFCRVCVPENIQFPRDATWLARDTITLPGGLWLRFHAHDKILKYHNKYHNNTQDISGRHNIFWIFLARRDMLYKKKDTKLKTQLISAWKTVHYRSIDCSSQDNGR